MLDNPTVNTRWFLASGWREVRASYERLMRRHGTDPEWRDWLAEFDEEYVQGWARDEAGLGRVAK
jgi:hypothetical protein